MLSIRSGKIAATGIGTEFARCADARRRASAHLANSVPMPVAAIFPLLMLSIFPFGTHPVLFWQASCGSFNGHVNPHYRPLSWRAAVSGRRDEGASGHQPGARSAFVALLSGLSDLTD